MTLQENKSIKIWLNVYKQVGEAHKTPLFQNIYWKFIFRNLNHVAGTEIKVIPKASTDLKLWEERARKVSVWNK